MKKTIDSFLTSKKLGIAGISTKPQKFGNSLYKEITSAGYDVYPVARNLDKIEGRDCLKDVSSLYGITESLIIATGKQDAIQIVRNLDPAQIKRVWFSKGSESDEAFNTVREKNIEFVHGICPLMFFRPLGFHKLHVFFSKLFGSYKKVYG